MQINAEIKKRGAELLMRTLHVTKDRQLRIWSCLPDYAPAHEMYSENILNRLPNDYPPLNVCGKQ